MVPTKRKSRTERYVVVKEPDVKRLFSKSVERYRIGDKSQLTISGAPDVQKVVTEITAYYVRQIGTIRLFSTGSTAWAMPLAIEPNDDYAAITLALDEAMMIEQSLPDFVTPDDAVAAWKMKFRGRESEFFDGETQP